MGPRDAVEALAEGQRAARSEAPAWGHATPWKLWPKANAQLGAPRRVREEIELPVGVFRSLEAPELNPEATCGARTG